MSRQTGIVWRVVLHMLLFFKRCVRSLVAQEGAVGNLIFFFSNHLR